VKINNCRKASVYFLTTIIYLLTLSDNSVITITFDYSANSIICLGIVVQIRNVQICKYSHRSVELINIYVTSTIQHQFRTTK